MIQIEFLLTNVWQKASVGEVFSCVFVCHKHGWKRKKKWKKKKELKKCEKSTKVLFVEERVQNNKFGPKNCLNLPLVFLSWFLHTKVNSKSQFHYLAYYAWRTFVFPILSLLTNTPSPVATLNFFLSVMCFNLWSLNLVWAYGVTDSRI